MALDLKRPVAAAPLWAVVASGGLTLVGLGISIYMTIVHFVGKQALVCSSSGAIDCWKVTTSPQSYFFHIPVAILGLGYFIGGLVINSPWAWRARDARIHVARIVYAVLGIGFVLWLIAAELLIIKSLCLWCSGVHLVTFALFIITMASVPTMLAAQPQD